MGHCWKDSLTDCVNNEYHLDWVIIAVYVTCVDSLCGLLVIELLFAM